MLLRTYQCSDIELAVREGELRARGFHISAVTSEKLLRPMEYMKQVYTGTPSSFEGQQTWILTWRTS